MTSETLARIVLDGLILTTGVAVLCLLWSTVRWFIQTDKHTSAPNSLRHSLESHSEEVPVQGVPPGRFHLCGPPK